MFRPPYVPMVSGEEEKARDGQRYTRNSRAKITRNAKSPGRMVSAKNAVHIGSHRRSVHRGHIVRHKVGSATPKGKGAHLKPCRVRFTGGGGTAALKPRPQPAYMAVPC